MRRACAGRFPLLRRVPFDHRCTSRRYRQAHRCAYSARCASVCTRMIRRIRNAINARRCPECWRFVLPFGDRRASDDSPSCVWCHTNAYVYALERGYERLAALLIGVYAETPASVLGTAECGLTCPGSYEPPTLIGGWLKVPADHPLKSPEHYPETSHPWNRPPFGPS